MKDAYYFSHDGNARNDPKMLILRAEFKAQGYAYYFMILEMMREAHDYKLPLPYLCQSVAIGINETPELTGQFIDKCLELGLFQKSDKYLYSESFLRRMDRKEKLSQTRRENGKLGAMAKWQNNGKQDGKNMAVKESKVKESKEKRIPITTLGFDEFWQAYPKKVGKDKAIESWNKRKPDLQICLKALEWQTAQDQWRKDGGQYIPLPATWLNQGRWADEPLKKPTTGIPGGSVRAWHKNSKGEIVYD